MGKGGVAPSFRAAEPKSEQNGQQNEYFKLKESAIFKIFRKIKDNLIDNCNFLEFIISFRGCQKLATPLGVSPPPI